MKIQGSGDGNSDYYRFTLTSAMLQPTSGTVSNTTTDGTQYYTIGELKLTGTVKTNDIWKLGLRYRDYTFKVLTANPTLQTVADGLQAQINLDTAQTGRYLIQVVGGDTIRITQIVDGGGGFNLIGVATTGITQTVQSAGSVTRTTTASQTTGTDISFNPADVTLTGSTAIGDVWTTRSIISPTISKPPPRASATSPPPSGFGTGAIGDMGIHNLDTAYGDSSWARPRL